MSNETIQEIEDAVKVVKHEWPPSNTTQIGWRDLNEIVRILERHHGIFYQFWKMGRPRFSKAIDTACVAFDPERGTYLDFLFNPSFWDSMDNYQRAWVICHESLHVLLNHGKRLKRTDGHDSNIANVAMDIVINESLDEDFGFDRERLDSHPVLGHAMYIESVFKKPEIIATIKRNQNAEYYYEQIIKYILSGDIEVEYVAVDSHGDHRLPGSGKGKGLKDVIDKLDREIDNKMKKNMNQILEEKGDFAETEFQDYKKEESEGGKQAGTGEGRFFKIELKPRVVKRKWDTIIRNIARKQETEFKEEQTFYVENHRMKPIQAAGNEIFMEGTHQFEYIKKNIVRLWFFLDTSGSCAHLADRFFAAARSLDPKKFDIRLFCFDTNTYETDLQSGKAYGFGGTCFKCIEDRIIQQTRKEGIDYPKCVFLITDGEGTPVSPKKPQNWYWFLTEGGSRNYIPAESKVFNLENFE